MGQTVKNISPKRRKLPKIIRSKSRIVIEDKREKHEKHETDINNQNGCFGSPALWLKKRKEEKKQINKAGVNENKISTQTTVFKPLILSNKFNNCSVRYFLKSNKNTNGSQNSQGGNTIGDSNMNVTNNGLAEIDEQIVRF